jgi:hypothetical protein
MKFLKSKYAIILICSCVIISCEIEKIQPTFDGQNSINSLVFGTKQLTEIRENGKKLFEFIYDSEKRLVKLNKYYSDTIISAETYEYLDNRLSKRIYNGFVDTYLYNDKGWMISKESYYQKTGKTWKEIYQYNRSNQVEKAICYFNGSEDGYINYKYDSNGNTIERKQYNGDFLTSELRLTFDNKINPLKNLLVYPIEVIQKNNVTYYYNYLAIMSSYPPEYTSTFEYDESGYPIKEQRTYSRYSGPDKIPNYEYLY